MTNESIGSDTPGYSSRPVTVLNMNTLHKAFAILAVTVVLAFLTSCFANNSTPIGTQVGVVSEDAGEAAPGNGNGRDKEGDVSNDDEGLFPDQGASLAVEILSDNPGYTLKTLKKGNLVFIDRPYYFSDIGGYEGYCTLQTAMSDKGKEGAGFLHFTISRSTTIYVGYDVRRPIPTWLSDWVDTGDEITMADDNARYWPYLKLRLFRKSFPKGTVELGGNGGAGSMYVVLLENEGDSCTLLNDKKVILSWYPNEDEVDGYEIYLKKGAEMVPVLSVDVEEMPDPRNPSATFRSWSDLGISDDNACFAVSAYRDNIESDLSRVECSK